MADTEKEKGEKKLAIGMSHHESNDLLIVISMECDGQTIKLGEYHKVVAELFAEKLNDISRHGGTENDAMENLLGCLNTANKALMQLYFFDVTIK